MFTGTCGLNNSYSCFYMLPPYSHSRKQLYLKKESGNLTVEIMIWIDCDMLMFDCLNL